MNNRIKLAELIGWKHKPDDESLWRPIGIDVGPWIHVSRLPDPENDANDDYAILECMRLDPQRFNDAECETEKSGWAWKYQIGYYAKLALEADS